MDKGAKVVVVTYDLLPKVNVFVEVLFEEKILLNVQKKHVESLSARKFGSFVLDESHYLKNAEAKRTQSVNALIVSAKADTVVLLLSVNKGGSKKAALC